MYTGHPEPNLFELNLGGNTLRSTIYDPDVPLVSFRGRGPLCRTKGIPHLVYSVLQSSTPQNKWWHGRWGWIVSCTVIHVRVFMRLTHLCSTHDGVTNFPRELQGVDHLRWDVWRVQGESFLSWSHVSLEFSPVGLMHGILFHSYKSKSLLYEPNVYCVQAKVQRFLRNDPLLCEH